VSFATYKKAKVADYVFAPGSGFPNEAMPNDMVCQIIEGELWVKQGELEYTAKTGHLFACAKDSFEEDKNRSDAVAVMRVINLLPA
jgi:quercetin dioxygenase-like cupin family protein